MQFNLDKGKKKVKVVGAISCDLSLLVHEPFFRIPFYHAYKK